MAHAIGRLFYRIVARASSLRMDLSISARLDLPISRSNSLCIRSRAAMTRMAQRLPCGLSVSK